MKKFAINAIAIFFAVAIMALVAEEFGSFFTAITGIVCYRFTVWFENYFGDIEI